MQGLCELLGPPGLRELHMQHKHGRGALLPEMVVVLMPHSPEVLLGSPYCQTTKNVCMDQAKPRLCLSLSEYLNI